MKTEKSSVGDHQVVVVEIGNEWLKLAQVERAESQTELTRVFLQRIEGEGPSAATIADAMQKGGFHRGPVLSILPRHMVNVRMLEFPSVDPREITDMVELQVGRQTPYSRDEIIFDFKILGSSREGYSRVMLVIVQSVLVRHRFGLLEEAGLPIAQMSISTEGLLNWAAVQAAPDSGATDRALLDIDANFSDFSVLRGGQLAFTRSIPLGANGLQDNDAKTVGRLFQEIGRAIETHRSETPGAKLDTLIITGAPIDSAPLQERLQAEFNLRVEVRRAWQDLATEAAAAELQKPDNRLVSLTALLGAGLRPRQLDIDLTPEAVVIRKSLVMRARNLTRFGMLVMTLIILLAVLIEGRVAHQAARLDQLRQWLRQTDPDAKAIRTKERRSELAAERLNARLSTVNLLNEVQGLVPNSIYLTSLQVEVLKPIILRGVANSPADINHFVNILEASPLLANVKIANTKAVRDKTEFEIVCTPES